MALDSCLSTMPVQTRYVITKIVINVINSQIDRVGIGMKYTLKVVLL